MKYKRLTVPEYTFYDAFGSTVFYDIEILIPSDSTITAETFNHLVDDYAISSNEIMQLCVCTKKPKKAKKA